MDTQWTAKIERFFTFFARRQAWLTGLILVSALLAFEAFNFSTTQFALADLLGKITFAGIPWASILAIAFCGIDFAGIFQIFSNGINQNSMKEEWYLFGAWLVAATMNALLTWWGVAMALANRSLESAAILNPKTIMMVVPVFVALVVWITRILMIGSFSNFSRQMALQPAARRNSSYLPNIPTVATAARPRPVQAHPRPEYASENTGSLQPSYHSLAAAPRPSSNSSRKF